MNFEKVLVFGGTHGNEWTGIYAIKQFSASLIQEFPSLKLEFIHSNPEAFRMNRRFRDEDLNRSFENIKESRPNSYENQRARQLKQLISGETFVIDLHTTTSNMGVTLIISQDHPLNFFIASKLLENAKDLKILYSPDPSRKYLVSQSDMGFMIEVGPVPNNVLQGQALQDTLSTLRNVLKELSSLPQTTAGQIEIYEEVDDVFFPEEQGELAAYIHEDFQNKDFQEVNGTYTPFRTFSGQEIRRVTTEKLYPVFINEAAYYPKRLAFTLCRKNLKRF